MGVRVIFQHRPSEFVVRLQPLADHVFPIVLAADEQGRRPRRRCLARAAVANSDCKCASRQGIAAVAVSLATRASAGTSRWITMGIPMLRLSSSSRRNLACGTVRGYPSSRNPWRQSDWLMRSGQHLVDDFVGYKPAAGQDRTCQFAQFRIGFTFGPEHLSRGYGGDPKAARYESGLRAFAASGGAKQQNGQGISAHNDNKISIPF